MLNRSFRLNKNKEFDQVFQAGHSFFVIFLGIKAIKNEATANKFGVLVGLKVSKLAVKRNLVKRRIKAVLQKENKNLKQGYNIVVITKPEIVDYNYQEIKEEISRGFNKLNLYV